MSKKEFIYLVQADIGLPQSYAQIESPTSDVLCLTWKQEAPGCIFFPQSTWTEGRNRLLKEALNKDDYKYYIFLDDDVFFREGDFRTMEQNLLQYEPAVATPFYTFHPHPYLELDVHTVYSFDAMFNAFHRDLLKDGIVLPYYDGFDSKSWWFSQLCVIHLSSVLYPDHVLKFNKIKIENHNHRQYPRNQVSEFEEMEKWIKKNIFKDTIRVSNNFKSHPKIKREEVYRSPFHKMASYRIPQAVQDEILNWDSPYWKRIAAIKNDLG